MPNQIRLPAGRRKMLDRSIHAHMPRAGTMACFQYVELISVIRSNSTILTPHAIGNGEACSLDQTVTAIARMARCWNSWIRPVYNWFPDRSTSNFAQFRSLVQHLFVQYELPDFLASCWFEGGRAIRLFIALGRGRSIRKCRMPIPFTKSIARHFMGSPHDLSIETAMRWAQVCSYGGSNQLARDLLRTRLRNPQRDEPFWEEFLRFVTSNEQGRIQSGVVTRFDAGELDEMVEYCHRQRYCLASQILGYNVLDDRPLQPELSVKGRSVRWLRQRMANWRNEIELPARTAIRLNVPTCTFSGTDVGPLTFNNEDSTWAIEQITNSQMLQVEGGIMQHCVASYARRCRVGSTSIWSLKQQTGERKKRLVTIELWPRKKVVVQVKGKRNSEPSQVAVELIRKWVRQEGLTWPGDTYLFKNSSGK